MAKEKVKWRSIGLPDTLFEKIRKLIVFVGCPSVSEYVREAARRQYEKDFDRLEESESDEM